MLTDSSALWRTTDSNEAAMSTYGGSVKPENAKGLGGAA
jgi:hypothetical protein